MIICQSKEKNLLKFTDSELKVLRKICLLNEKNFQATISEIAPEINNIASYIPNRRERMLHVGLFGYSRGYKNITLPRAIKFTAALYSIGIPPEIIGTGRTLFELAKKGDLALLESTYLNLKRDLVHAGHYLNLENLDFLAKKNKAWEDIKADIGYIEEVLGIKLGPQDKHHYLHRNLTSTVYFSIQVGESSEDEIVKAAKIRRSLG
jgi:phosphoenolpyruvate carboxylase